MFEQPEINLGDVVKNQLIAEAATAIAEFEFPATFDECTKERQKGAEALAEDLLTSFAVRYVSAMDAVISACETFEIQYSQQLQYIQAAEFQVRRQSWEHIRHTISHWTKGFGCSD